MPNLDEELAQFTARQRHAVDLLDSGYIKFLLYGGALGGGKSYFLRWYGLRRLYLLARWGFPQAVAMLACEDYPSLKDRQLQKIGREFSTTLGTGFKDHGEYGRCFILAPELGGGILAFRNLDDPSKYASAEFALILVDELTKNLYDVFTHLRTRLRWPGLPDEECQFVGATNPGGVGHMWVKQLWMDRDFPREWIHPNDYRNLFAYVPSRAEDNPHLDPAYWAMLETLPKALRRAFREGDWTIFAGQAFDFREHRHVIKVPPPAPWVQLYMTYDWGYGKPFSIGWWYPDADGRIYRFMEWYGSDGTPDVGLRITDGEVATGIIEREKARGITNRQILRLAGQDCFSKKPDYRGGGQGPSTAETFAKHGIILTPADDDRKKKIRQFHARLAVPANPDELPMMVVDESCRDFVRTIPSLVVDEKNIEDVDTTQEDHVYDEACHICMARPLAIKPEEQKDPTTQRIERLTRPILDNQDMREILEIGARLRQSPWEEEDPFNPSYRTERGYKPYYRKDVG